MTDLTDNEIEEILDCLAEQGIDYVMSKKDMKELLKKNAKKSDSSENISEEDVEISKTTNVENSKTTTLDIDDIENSIIEKDIENNIKNNIDDNIDDINVINYNKIRDISDKNAEIDKIMEDADNRLKDTLNKTRKIKEEHSRISNNLKNIREKLDENYNTIVEKQDKIGADYISKLNNIKDTLKKSILPKKCIVPPLNLEEIDKYNTFENDESSKKETESYSKEDLYNKLHNRIINRPLFKKTNNYENGYETNYENNFRNRYPPPTQNGYNPLEKNLYNRPRYSRTGFMTERNPPAPPSRHLSDRYNPSLNNRTPHNYQSPLLNRYTPREPPQPISSRYPPARSYSSIEDRYPLSHRDRLYNRNRGSAFDKIDDYYKKYTSLLDKKTDYNKKNDYVNFDDLYKKYNSDKDGEHEIIITATGPPSNALDIINSALDKFEQEIYLSESKSEKATLRGIFDKLKNNKKQLPKYDKDEMAYYDTLSEQKKEKIDKLELKISNINNIKTPLRFRVLQSNLPLYNKSMIINKIEDLFSNKLMGGSEITKYSNWVNSLLKVPFKKYKKLPIDVASSTEDEIGTYLIDVKKTLDTAVYGHTKTKEQVIQIIAQWITNPNCIGNCIGIQGVMGNGKTTLVKNGIAKAIGRPFAFITLGGCSDSSFLEGHNYTYEGSMWGKIVDVLMECKCMNPVFYFDELDKVSETPKGEEIINSLIHLTDSSQNNQYADKYFNGIEFDLSKSLFIFSYNDITKINPILLDRLICIKTDAFELDDKIHIAQKYLLREIYEQLKIKEDTYKIEDDNIKYIIETYTGDEGGVRTLKKHLYNIFSKFNLLNLTKNDDSIKYSFDLEKDVLEKKIITNDIIDTFIKDKGKTGEDEYFKNWYM